LDDGISSGLVHVAELHTSGTVPELKLENKADKPVLLLNGEELLGAKQNRVLNLTILAPSKCVIVIPVSCVEAGRWQMNNPDFQPAGHVMYSEARAEQVSQVTQSMRSSGTPASDQGSVWRSIAAKAARLKSVSPTGAMSEIYRSHAASVEAFVRAFSWQEQQSGAAFCISGQLVGIDVFDHPKVMQKLLPKLLRSYALDALDRTPETSAPANEQELTTFMTRLGQAQTFSDQALGLGKDIRFYGDGVTGAGLWAEGRYVHICAFVRMRSEGEGPAVWTHLTRPSRRPLF